MKLKNEIFFSFLFIHFSNFILSIPLEEYKYLEIPLISNIYGMPGISLSLGSPPQTFDFYISTILHKTYITSKNNYEIGFSPNNSISYFSNNELQKLPFISNKAKGISSQDSLLIHTKYGSAIVPNFNFFLLTEGDYGFHYIGSFGLEHTFENKEDEKYSVINMLYKEGKIAHKIFFLTKMFNKVTLTIGRFPIDYFNTKTYKFCSLSSSPYWQCQLNAIYFDDYSLYPINEYVTFSLSGNIMCVSDYFYTQMKQKYFYDALMKNECNEEVKENKKTLICIYPYTVPKDPEISFIFGKWNIKFKMNKLFFVTGDYEKWFALMKCKDDEFKWSMGYHYFSGSTIVFDKENEKLGFNLYNNL